MVCLVDNSCIINISYSSFVNILKEKNGDDYNIKEDDLGLYWHLYMLKIKDYLSTYKDIIFCGEGHNSTKWRKEKYPLYKENRKDRADNPDYRFIINCYKDSEKLLNLFHCKSIRVENCEADDVIYKLTEYYTNKGEQVVIISSDKDLTQMCNYFDGVEVFNPLSNLNKRITPIINSENCNKNIILEKAIVGDPSDNIKGIPRIGKKTFENMLNDKELWNKKMTSENQEIMERILDIVDLRRYPKEYQDSILKQFEETEWNEFKPVEVSKFFEEHNLQQCLNNWGEWSDAIKFCLATEENQTSSAEDEIMELLNS